VNSVKLFFGTLLGRLCVLGLALIVPFVIYGVSVNPSNSTGLPKVSSSERDTEPLESWPSRPITIIAGNRVGGVFDIMARGLAKHLSRDLGVTVVVQNISGATTKAANYLLRQPDDGYTYLVSAPVPFMVWAMNNDDVKFELDDFVFINNQWNSMAGLMLNNKHNHKDALSLFQDIKENPLKYAAAILPRSGGQINVLLTLEAMGIPPENLRMVYYSSGSQLRTAVAGGQVDFGIVTHESYVSIREFARLLAAFQPELSVFAPEGLRPGTDVPTINQMLEDQGKNVEFVPSSLKSVIASKSFQAKYPDRYQKIVDAFRRVTTSEAFIADMKKQFVAYDWQGPEASNLESRKAYDLFVEYNDLLKKYE